MSQNYEIELRYQINDVETTLANLKDKGVEVVSRQRIIDEWFAPATIRSLADEQQWFEQENGVAWRLRTTEVNGVFSTVQDSKQLPEGDISHVTFIESPAISVEHDAAKQILESQGLRNWLTIDKTRYTLRSQNNNMSDVTIILDSVAGLAQKIGVGASVEIEYTGPEIGFDRVMQYLQQVALALGFDDSQRFEKSLTVAAKPALADFSHTSLQPEA